jgi:hypothetical protein
VRGLEYVICQGLRQCFNHQEQWSRMEELHPTLTQELMSHVNNRQEEMGLPCSPQHTSTLGPENKLLTNISPEDSTAPPLHRIT